MNIQRAIIGIWYALCLSLAGCQSVGLPTADTFKERLAVGYTTVTAVRQSATTLLEAKRISADDAQNVLEQTNNARAGLDIARKLEGVDLKAADAKVSAVRTVLEALSAYLASRKGG